VRTLRLALAQVNATVGDVEGNTRLVCEQIARAREAEADVVAFPELVISGYPPEDLLLKPGYVRACELALEIEPVRDEPVDYRTQGRRALSPLVVEGGSDQTAPDRKVFVRRMQQLGVRLDDTSELVQVGILHGFTRARHGRDLPVARKAPECRCRALEQHLPARGAVGSRYRQPRVVFGDDGREDVVHAHPV
jgi:hypothetical protein